MFGGNATDHIRPNDEPDGVSSLHQTLDNRGPTVVDPENLLACANARCANLCKLVMQSSRTPDTWRSFMSACVLHVRRSVPNGHGHHESEQPNVHSGAEEATRAAWERQPRLRLVRLP